MGVKGWVGRLAPSVAAAVAGGVALGPVLGPGFALRYDMVFVPDPPLSAVTLGAGDGFPRAVPSDAVIAAFSTVLPADLVQSLALLAVFVVGGSGAARLVPGTALLPRLAAAVFYVWNPFISERLLLGQWALLLGYAGLPWLLAAVVRSVRPGGMRELPRRFALLVTTLIPAAIGGFSSVVLSALLALPVAVVLALARGTLGNSAGEASDARAADPSEGVTSRAVTAGPSADGASHAVTAGPGSGPRGSMLRRVTLRAAPVGLVIGALVVVSLPWLVAALGSGARADPAAVDLFAARADTPFGAVGSLLLLGGIWNAQAVPEWYGVPALAACRLVLAAAAVAGWVWLLRGGPQRVTQPRRTPGFGAGLSAAAVIGLAVALLGVSEPGRALLRALIGLWPGFGPLRDGQLYVAPLALLQAVGFGGAVAWVLRSTGHSSADHDRAFHDGVPHARALHDHAPHDRVPHDRAGHSSASHDHAPHNHAPNSHAPRVRADAGERRSGRRGERAFGGAVAVILVLAPLVVLPGLGWAAAGRLAPVRYPAEWTEVQRLVDADPRPGAVLSLPWSAYRGLDWAAGERTVVVLDPATKLFGRRTVWNDELRVEVGGEVRTVAGEDPLARAVGPLVDDGWPLRPAPGTAERLGAAGVRYVLIDREAARRALASARDAEGAPGHDAGEAPAGAEGGPAPDAERAPAPDVDPSADENTFSIFPDGAEVVHEGRRLTLIMLPEDHVRAPIERLSGLEVTGWFVTVGAILWSMVVSGSNLVPVRPARSTGMGTRKENRK